MLLYVGRFLAFKRVPLLVRAYARARREHAVEAPLVVWGGAPGEWEGEHPATVARACGLLGERPSAFFVGWRGHDELPDGLACADVLVAPSVDEPFGQVYLEAMSAGLPVIGTSTGGPPSFANIVPGEEDGWLIPPDDIPEKEFRISPEEVAALKDAEHCIMCGACYSACQIVALNRRYIGPHALLKAFLRVLDPRDSAPAERLADVAGDEGVYRCHTIYNCIDACPKHLNPTEAIETLRKLAQKRQAFEAARRERQKTLNEPVPSPAEP